jgi:hypothetical protein
MSSNDSAPANAAIAVGGPLCGEQITRHVARLWHCFDPDLEFGDAGARNDGGVGAHTMAGDDADLGRLLHRVIERHGYLLPAAVIRGCYHRASLGDQITYYIDLGRDGDSPDQQRYRRLGIFMMYYASHRHFPKAGLRRSNPELAMAVQQDWPHDDSVQALVHDYMTRRNS